MSTSAKGGVRHRFREIMTNLGEIRGDSPRSPYASPIVGTHPKGDISMSTEWSKTTKYLVSIGLAIFGLYVLYLSSSVVSLVIIASLIAFLLMPLVDFFNGPCRIPRGLSVLLAYLILVVVILLTPLIFLPSAIDGFTFLLNIDYQSLVDGAQGWTEQTLLNLKDLDVGVLNFTLDLNPVVEPALTMVQDTEANLSFSLPSFETIMRSLRSAANITFGFASNVAGVVFSNVLTIIVTILSAVYLTLDAHKFTDRFLNTVPPAYRPEIKTLLHRLHRTWRAYLRGQLYLMIIIGVVTWVGATAIGLPGAFPLAVIAGVMELIPNLGPFLAAIPAVIVALIQGSTYLAVNNLIFALIVIGLYILIQQLENTFIVPRILGEAVDLHPFVVLIGVVIGANVAGILGALLAAPVIASGREIVSYLYAKILGEDPFPPESEMSEVVTVSWQEQGRQLIARGQQLVSKLRDAFQEQEDVPVIPPPEAESSNPDETQQEEAAL